MKDLFGTNKGHEGLHSKKYTTMKDLNDVNKGHEGLHGLFTMSLNMKKNVAYHAILLEFRIRDSRRG